MRGELLQQPVCMADHDHHEIIEVMRNASRQPSDSFHFLCMMKRLFGPFVIRDIGDGFDDVGPSVVKALDQWTSRYWLPGKATSLETTESVVRASGIRQKEQGD